ncbi:unnamed protein product, partial [Meganyctiphanes norvegica]
MERSTIKSPNKSPNKSPTRAGSPTKSGRGKGEHKVQFSDDPEQLGVRGTAKVVGKPPEVPRTSLSRFRLNGSGGSSSSSSSSSCSTSSSNIRLSSLGGSNPGLDSSSCSSSSSSGRGGETSKWSHSLDRKRAGSLRNKSNNSSSDRSSPQSKESSSRSHSLDRRRAESRRRESSSPIQSSNGERKRRGEVEEKMRRKIIKKRKQKHVPVAGGILHSRSFSGERSNSKTAHIRQRQTPPTLPTTPKAEKKDNKDSHSDQKCEVITSPGKLQRSQTEWAQRIKRPASRSPHRSHTTSDVPSLNAQDKESDKENEKIKDNKEHRSRERGRPLKRETRSNKQQLANVKTR